LSKFTTLYIGFTSEVKICAETVLSLTTDNRETLLSVLFAHSTCCWARSIGRKEEDEIVERKKPSWGVLKGRMATNKSFIA
jgi:hypothetical protein